MKPPITPGEILLKEYFIRIGISQNAMARAIGVAPRAINEINHQLTVNQLNRKEPAA